MTKSHLLGVYNTKINHIKLTYACLVLWSYPDTPKYFDALQRELIGIPEIFPDVSELVNDPSAMKVVCEELYDSAHRSAIKELFTLTRRYCALTGQMDKLKAQAWFEFWHIIRNCWSHNMTFCFSKDEKALLPVKWSGVTIDLSMNGKHLTHGVCSREKLRELIEESQAFISGELA